MAVLARGQLAGGPLTYGLLLGAYGVGSVAAGFVVRPLLSRFGSETVVLMASISTAIGTLIIAFSPFLSLSMAALILVGIGWVLALSTCNTAIQLAVPRWVVARALSIYQMAAYGAMAVGAATFGALADRYGTVAALLAAVGVHVVSMILGRFMPIIDEERDLAPHQWHEPDVALPIEGRSGPIVISIAYQIDETDVPAFLALMAELRRVRRRDGAHGWTLMRDLGSPERWIERYDVMTWHDYLRHNQRHTVADAYNWDAILALHRGTGGPTVTRLIERRTADIPSSREATARELAPFSSP